MLVSVFKNKSRKIFNENIFTTMKKKSKHHVHYYTTGTSMCTFCARTWECEGVCVKCNKKCLKYTFKKILFSWWYKI